MSNSPNTPIVVTYLVDPEEMARRGRLGAAALHARYDSCELTTPGRQAFLAKFATPEERSAYFRAIARKSADVRRAHAIAASGGAL